MFSNPDSNENEHHDGLMNVNLMSKFKNSHQNSMETLRTRQHILSNHIYEQALENQNEEIRLRMNHDVNESEENEEEEGSEVQKLGEYHNSTDMGNFDSQGYGSNLQLGVQNNNHFYYGNDSSEIDELNQKSVEDENMTNEPKLKSESGTYPHRRFQNVNFMNDSRPLYERLNCALRSPVDFGSDEKIGGYQDYQASQNEQFETGKFEQEMNAGNRESRMYHNTNSNSMLSDQYQNQHFVQTNSPNDESQTEQPIERRYPAQIYQNINVNSGSVTESPSKNPVSKMQSPSYELLTTKANFANYMMSNANLRNPGLDRNSSPHLEMNIESIQAASLSSLHSRTIQILKYSKPRVGEGVSSPKSIEQNTVKTESRKSIFQGGGANRKYCINKLFQKATGVSIDRFKKAQEYKEVQIKLNPQSSKVITQIRALEQSRERFSPKRSSVNISPRRKSSVSPHAASPKGIRTTQGSVENSKQRSRIESVKNLDENPLNETKRYPLRLKSKSNNRQEHLENSKSSRIQVQDQGTSFGISEEMSAPIKIDSITTREAKHTKSQSQIQTGSKSYDSRLRRYKQIEKEMEHQRRIQELEHYNQLKQTEEEERKAKIMQDQLNKSHLREKHQQSVTEFEQLYKEEQKRITRKKMEKEEEERQKQFVQDTMNMMKKFELEYPHLVESESPRFNFTEQYQGEFEKGHNLSVKYPHQSQTELNVKQSESYLGMTNFNIPMRDRTLSSYNGNQMMYLQRAWEDPTSEEHDSNPTQNHQEATYYAAFQQHDSACTLGIDTIQKTEERQNTQNSFHLNPNESLLGLNRHNFQLEQYSEVLPHQIHHNEYAQFQQQHHRSYSKEEDTVVSSHNTSLRTKNERVRQVYNEQYAVAPGSFGDRKPTHFNQNAASDNTRDRLPSIPDTVPCRGPTGGRQRQLSPISDMKLKSQFGRIQQQASPSPAQMTQPMSRFHHQHQGSQAQFEITQMLSKQQSANQRLPQETPMEQSLRQIPVYHQVDQADNKPFAIQPCFYVQLQEQVQDPYLNLHTQQQSKGQKTQSRKSSQFGSMQSFALQDQVQNCLVNLNQNLAKCHQQKVEKIKQPVMYVQLTKDQFIPQDNDKDETVSESHSQMGNSFLNVEVPSKIHQFNNNSQFTPSMHQLKESESSMIMNTRQVINHEPRNDSRGYQMINPNTITLTQPVVQKSEKRKRVSRKREDNLKKEAGHEDRDKRKKAAKVQRDKDIQKLMKLQVQQATMLMDLVQQKAFQEDETEELRSSATSQLHQPFNKSRQMNMSYMSRESGESHLSIMQHKSTVELIQAIYKQMEKINSELNKKQPLKDQTIFKDLEKKMERLTRKYHHVAKQNKMNLQKIQKNRTQKNERPQGSSQVEQKDFSQQISQCFNSLSSGRNEPEPGMQSQTFTIRTTDLISNNENNNHIASQQFVNIEDHSLIAVAKTHSRQDNLQPIKIVNNHTQDCMVSTKKRAKTNLEIIDSQMMSLGGDTIEQHADFNQQFPSVNPSTNRSQIEKKKERAFRNELFSKERLKYEPKEFYSNSQKHNEHHHLMDSRLRTFEDLNDNAEESLDGFKHKMSRSQAHFTQFEVAKEMAQPQKEGKLQTILSVPTAEYGLAEGKDQASSQNEQKQQTIETVGILTNQVIEQKEMAKNLNQQLQPKILQTFNPISERYIVDLGSTPQETQSYTEYTYKPSQMQESELDLNGRGLMIEGNHLEEYFYLGHQEAQCNYTVHQTMTANSRLNLRDYTDVRRYQPHNQLSSIQNNKIQVLDSAPVSNRVLVQPYTEVSQTNMPGTSPQYYKPLNSIPSSTKLVDSRLNQYEPTVNSSCITAKDKLALPKPRPVEYNQQSHNTQPFDIGAKMSDNVPPQTQSHGTAKQFYDLSDMMSPSIQTFKTDLIKPALQNYPNADFARHDKQGTMDSPTNRSSQLKDFRPLTETDREGFSRPPSNMVFGLAPGNTFKTRPVKLSHSGHSPTTSNHDTSSKQMTVTLNKKFADSFRGGKQPEVNQVNKGDTVQRVIQVQYDINKSLSNRDGNGLVGEKASLEQKLARIKEMLQKAKQIKDTPMLSESDHSYDMSSSMMYPPAAIQHQVAKNLESQVAQLNIAIGQLRENQDTQIARMQEFYNDQISKIRAEYSQQQLKTFESNEQKAAQLQAKNQTNQLMKN